MGWLANLFAGATQRSRNGQVLSSTHEAFSLPTSSPIHQSHPDAFNPGSLNTPLSAASSVYTYPPQGPASYGYVPTSAGLSQPHSASGAILPTHMDPMHSPMSPAYPPLAKTWSRIRAWLSREYPELGDTLNYGILPLDLKEIEMQFGFSLPPVVRESYLCCDGQEAESAAGCSEGLFFGLTLLPLESVLEEWKFWREVDNDPATGANVRLKGIMQSIPPAWVRREYSQRGWIPLIADKAGNYVGVDMNPAESGQPGQVIVFGRDFDTKVVLWRGDGTTGWAKWLSSFVEELETGDGFELGPADGSDDSEDELGYESYFYDGTGRGQGDGGGDTGGVGGLRLTGEYKGWNVMEAWADRSLRKWHEAGLVTEVSLVVSEEETKGKGIDPVGLGVVEVSDGTGAEIPIPVLNDAAEPIPPPTVVSHAVINEKRASKTHRTSQSLSGIKAPAPRPVLLPTALDIEELATPRSSFDQDLESGRSQGTTVVAPTQEKALPPHPINTQFDTTRQQSLDVLSPGSDVTTPLVQISRTDSDPFPTPTVPDMFADSTPVMNPTSIESSNSNSPVVISLNDSLTDSPKAVQAELEVEQEPEATIRLVGGGGNSGVSLNSSRSSDEPVRVDSAEEVQKEVDAASIHSDSSTKSQRKSKAFSGLKRLSQFGAKRKGTSGSVKDLKDG